MDPKPAWCTFNWTKLMVSFGYGVEILWTESCFSVSSHVALLEPFCII